jgi:hypothetical protein
MSFSLSPILLFIFMCLAPIHAISQDTLQLCSNISSFTKSNTITLSDNRDYKKNIGKLKTYDKDQWHQLFLAHNLQKTFTFLHDSIAHKLNMNQHYFINIRSFYIQENKMKGTSMKYARIAYMADYYVTDNDNKYTLTYTTDTSFQVTSYLLPITISNEIKMLLQYSMIKCKNSLPHGKTISMEEIETQMKNPAFITDIFSDIKSDGLYFTWEELSNNMPSFANNKINSIKGIGIIQLTDTMSMKKSKQSIFELYAYSQQGILYKCTKFGSSPLLNYNNNYYFIGFDEKHFTPRQDNYTYKKVRKNGGLSLRADDIESQKYLFKINPSNGKLMIVCSILPNDDLSDILLEFGK